MIGVYVQLQCPKEIHQLVIEAENLVKAQGRFASDEVLRQTTVRRTNILMDSSKSKRVAQWLESHPAAMPLPPVDTSNTDCDASCEYTGKHSTHTFRTVDRTFS